LASALGRIVGRLKGGCLADGAEFAPLFVVGRQIGQLCVERDVGSAELTSDIYAVARLVAPSPLPLAPFGAVISDEQALEVIAAVVLGRIGSDGDSHIAPLTQLGKDGFGHLLPIEVREVLRLLDGPFKSRGTGWHQFIGEQA